MKPSNEELIYFIQEYQVFDKSNRRAFEDLITVALRIFDLTQIENELTNIFQVRPTVIHRWAKGIDSPHQNIKQAIYDFLIRKTENLLIERLAGIDDDRR